jgi:hypothetical protein
MFLNKSKIVELAGFMLALGVIRWITQLRLHHDLERVIGALIGAVIGSLILLIPVLAIVLLAGFLRILWARLRYRRRAYTR